MGGQHEEWQVKIDDSMITINNNPPRPPEQEIEEEIQRQQRKALYTRPTISGKPLPSC